MGTRIKGRLSLLLLSFAVVMLIFPALALAQDAGDSTSSTSTAPTIQSDKADYPPGGTVILTGSNWQPGESVHIYVNDDEGKTWERNVDVTADENGNIRDEFQLPDWFVAVYKVTATGAQSGVATTSFTDGNVKARTNASGYTFRLDWTQHNGTNASPQRACNATVANQESGFEAAVGFSGGAQFSKGVNENSSIVLKAADTASDGKIFTGWTGETASDTFLTRTDKHEICVPGNFTGARMYVANYEVNSPPTVTRDNASRTVDEGQTATNTGTWADANALDTVTLSASVGTVTKNADGTWSWSYATTDGPDQGQTVTITATDNHGSSSTTTFALTVNNVAPAVTAAADQSSDEGQNKSFDLGSFTDPGVDGPWQVTVNWGDGSTPTSFNSATTGSLGSQSHTYANDGTYTVTVTVAEAGSGTTPSDSKTFKVTVANVAPTANGQSVTTDEDVAKAITLVGNDAGNDALTYHIVSGPSHGTLSAGTGANRTYTPNPNYHGSDSFTFKVNDGSADSNVATVSITVNPLNDAPVAANDAYDVDEDGELSIDAPGVLGNDSDVDGDSLTAAKVVNSGPSNGTLDFNADGSFTYTPNDDFFGTDSFEYKADDGSADSNVAKVTITVKAVNDAPVANDDAATTDEDTAIVIDVVANDTDVDNNNDDLSVVSTSLGDPANGTAELITSGANEGKILYTPDADYNNAGGATADTFAYKVSDGAADSNEATVRITVDPVNDVPVANDDDGATTNEDTPLDISAADLLNNDTDVDGDTLSISDFDAQTTQGGTVSLDNGTFTYTPAQDFHGSDSFNYTVSDGNGKTDTATVSITVNPVNDAPVLDLNGGDEEGLNYDEATFTEDGGAVGIVDTSNPGGLSVSDVDDTNMESATATLNNPLDGPAESLSVDASGVPSINVTTYNANTGVLRLEGPATKAEYQQVLRTVKYDNASQNPSTADRVVEFVVNDGELDSLKPNSTVAVISVNDAPEADSQAVITEEDTSKLITLTASDVDNASSSLTYKVTSLPAHGKLYMGNSTNAADEIKAIDLPAALSGNQVTYKPDLNYNNTAATADTFKFVANDGTVDSSAATVSITVNPVNDAPVAQGDAYSVDEDNALDIAAPGVLANDSDVDSASLTAVLVTGPAHGQLTLNADGSFRYTPDEDYNGPDSFTYKASDGSLDSNVVTVSITVNAVNDAPVADIDSETTPEDTPVYIDVLNNDNEGAANESGQTLYVKSVGEPANGEAQIVTSGPEQGKILYTPDPNYHGSDTFTYEVCDNGSPEQCTTENATVNVTITSVNDAPTANAQSVTTNEDIAKEITLSGNDVDGDTLTYTVVSGPSHGTLSGTGANLTYTPDPDYHGPDSFTFKVNDGTVDSDPATVSITVNPVNDAPTVKTPAADDTGKNEGATLSTQGAFQDAADNDKLTITKTAGAGTVVDNGDGTWSWSLQTRDNIIGSVTVTASDGKGGTVTDSFDYSTINVNPTASNGSFVFNPILGTATAGFDFSDAGFDDTHKDSYFTWSDIGNQQASVMETNGAGQASATRTLNPGCYNLTVTGTAKDDDGGASAPLTIYSNSQTSVHGKAFLPPIMDNERNIAKYGNVVPVKVQLTNLCTGGTVTNAALYITIHKGSGNEVIEDNNPIAESVSSADSGSQMRVVDGRYMYNLSTKNLTANQDWTIRVRLDSTTGPVLLQAVLYPKK